MSKQGALSEPPQQWYPETLLTAGRWAQHAIVLQDGPVGGPDTVMETSPLPQGLSVTVGSCPLPCQEFWLSMPEFGEKERDYLFKSYTGLE